MLGDQLRQDGVVYTKNGVLSFDPKLLGAMQSWDELKRGNPITVEEAKDLYSFCPKRGEKATVKHGFAKTLDSLDLMKPLYFKDLQDDHGLLADENMPPERVVNLSSDDEQYLKSIKRRGQMPTKPAVKLSTIHRMKGGEDENIVLLSEMGYMPYQTLLENPDDEHRVFYTAVTRTRENLHIVDTEGKYRYEL
jgi:hypothetical protein